MVTKPVMPAASDLIAGGKLSNAGTHYLEDLARSLSEVGDSLAVGHEPCFIETPDDKTYDIIPDAKFAFEINETTTDCSTGTATVTWKINGVALGGTANSASTTKQTQAHTSANTVAVGDVVSITVSANSSCENLATTYKYTRTL